MHVAPASSRKRAAAAPAELVPDVIALPIEVVLEARQGYLEALPIAVAIISREEDGQLSIEIGNGLFRSATGWNGVGSVPLDEMDFFGATGIGGAFEDFLARGESAYQFEARDTRSIGGRHFTVRFTKLKPWAFDGDRWVVSLIDRTVQVETEKNLRAEMLRDSLSGLPNRLAFTERVEATLRGPDYQPGRHAVVAIDMTRFSRVNECVGAIAGDELLITFARRLFSGLRPGDALARTGGDEFGVLLRLEHGIDDALRFAERIKNVLSAPFRLSDMEIRVDCAIGCALLSGGDDAAEETLRNAQFALKRAKASGRTQLYEHNQAQDARRRFTLETELRRAVEARALTMSLQPLVDLSCGRVAGFEALARWDHEELGQVDPKEFIEVAEESGLILPLGRWALDEALATLAEWDRRHGQRLPIYVAVNLSAVQIQRDDVPAMVAEALERHKIHGSRLMLEVTESAIILDPERATEVLEAMRKLHVRIAMDDFGTGYTSLAYLQRLPIDMLKIDGSFVTGMHDDPDATAIVRAVLSLAGSLKMETTAEGIESEGLVRTLRALGCTKGQGYHFAQPLGAEAAFDYWRSLSA